MNAIYRLYQANYETIERDFGIEARFELTLGESFDRIRSLFECGSEYYPQAGCGWADIKGETTEAALNRVFAESQNLDEPWYPKAPCRSTSVGDVIMRVTQAAIEYYVVDRIGFKRLWQQAEQD